MTDLAHEVIVAVAHCIRDRRVSSSIHICVFTSSCAHISICEKLS